MNAKRPCRSVGGRRRLIRLLAMGLPVLALCGVAWLWLERVQLRQIEIVGVRQADPETLRQLAAVDSGVALFALDPVLIADRVQRHPWVRTASVRRLPTGTLRIAVEERTPVVLLMDARGRPVCYLDVDGYGMPLGGGPAIDVPLLSGVPGPAHPMRPLEDRQVRALLAALAVLKPSERALIAEIVRTPQGEFWLYTTPAAGQRSIPVRLGTEDFVRRLRRLVAFWHQAVLTQPHKTFSLIDLRFANQIVVREQTHPSTQKSVWGHE
ncbi:MAG: FtsQ-type POTRA domain-containing protein [Rhodothermus sp.]|nr:FtsQ-type POTRA domain-containing protein [Rhodothermus sp.]